MAERATEKKKAPESSKAPQKKVQPKLAVSTPGDPYEREADRASSAVLSGAKLPPLTPLTGPEITPAQTKAKEEPETSPVQTKAKDEKVQTKAKDEKVQTKAKDEKVQTKAKDEKLQTKAKDEKVQTKSKDEKVQAKTKDEKVQAKAKDEKVQTKAKDEKVQTKAKDEKVQAKAKDEKVQTKAKDEKVQTKSKDEKVQAKAKEEAKPVQKAGSAAGPAQDGEEIAAQAMTARGSGSPMPASTRSRLEPSFGSLDHVRVHQDSHAQTATQALGARAFASGNEIWLGAGESATDVGLMAHETAHVFQQTGGVGRSRSAPASAPAAGATAVSRMMIQRTTHTSTPAPAAPTTNPGTPVSGDANTIQYDELEIPAFKAAAHRGTLYRNRATAGKLQRNKDFKRSGTNETTGLSNRTNHDAIWEQNLGTAPEPIRILTDKATRARPPFDPSKAYKWRTPDGALFPGTVQTAAKAFTHPTWAVSGRRHLYSVDHIVEVQVGDWPVDRWADTMENYELLDRPKNQASGGMVRAAVERKVGAWAQAEGMSLTDAKSQKNHRFNAVTANGGPTLSPDDYWTQDQIRQGAHLVNVQCEGEADNSLVYILSEQDQGAVGQVLNNDQTVTEAERTWLKPYRIKAKQFNTQTSQQGDANFGSLTIDLPAGDGNWAPQPERQLSLTRHEGSLLVGKIDATQVPLADLHHVAFSPVRLDYIGVRGGTGITAEGAILASIPLLPPGTEIPFQFADGELVVFKRFDTGAINAPRPLEITNSSLTVALGTTRGLEVSGQVDMKLGTIATGRLGAAAGTGSGLSLDGQLDFNPQIFDGDVSLAYREGQFSGSGNLRIGPNKIRGIRRGSLSVSYENETLQMRGEAEPQIPGIQSASLGVTHSPEQGFKITGDATLGEGIPGIRSGSLHLELQEAPEGWKMAGTGTAEPAIPGINSSLTVGYDDGLFLAEAHVGYQRGMLSGEIDVGVTNRPIDENGQPVDGDPTENLSVWGGGQLTLQLAPWLQGTAGVRFNPAGQISISGAIGLPSSLDVFPKKEINKDLFRTPPLDIPIVGVAAAGTRVGIFATLSGGLDVSASIGPGQLQELGLQVDYTPDDESLTRVHGGAKFHVPAEAGLRLSIRGGIGAGIPLVSASANLEVGGKLGIEGSADAAVDVDWTPQTGLVLDAEASFSAQPALTFDVTGFVLVEAGAFGYTIELYRHDWQLAEFSMGSDYRFGVSFPVHYQEGQPFDVSLDDVEFEVPEIDPMSTVSSLIDRITPATE